MNSSCRCPVFPDRGNVVILAAACSLLRAHPHVRKLARTDVLPLEIFVVQRRVDDLVLRLQATTTIDAAGARSRRRTFSRLGVGEDHREDLANLDLRRVVERIHRLMKHRWQRVVQLKIHSALPEHVDVLEERPDFRDGGRHVVKDRVLRQRYRRPKSEEGEEEEG